MLFESVSPKRLAALRIAFGTLACADFIPLFRNSERYFSDAGWISAQSASIVSGPLHWSVFYDVTSPLGVRAFMAIFILAALAMTLGFFSRLCNAIVLFGVVSLRWRNPLILYGGDQLLQFILLFLLFAPTGAAWSLDSRNRKPPACEIWPVRMIQIQVMVLYFTAGFLKFHSSLWREGSAVITTLQDPALSKVSASALLAGSGVIPSLLRFVDWTIMSWEVLFSGLVFFRITRPWALVLGACFHFGMIFTVRTNLFSYVMIASYIAFLPDSVCDHEGLRRFFSFKKPGNLGIQASPEGHASQTQGG